MHPFEGKIGVIGSGALGGFYGARLARAGANVHFLMRSDYDKVREDGLQVESVDGDFHLRPPVWRSAEEMGKCDAVLIGLKSTDNHALPTLLPPCAGPDTVVVTLQNGLGNEEAIEAALGPDSRGRIVGGTAFICSNRPAPGVIRHTSHGWVRLAGFSADAAPHAAAFAALLEKAGIHCEVHDSVPYIRWHKLVWNIPFNGLGVAAGGATTADILADDELAQLSRQLMEETRDAARADRVDIPDEFIQRMMDATTTMGPYRTSMQIDYEDRRPLEVEAIIGEPVRRARRAGIPVPRTEALYGLVRRLDTANRHNDIRP